MLESHDPAIDATALLDRCQNDLALARRIANRFATEAPGHLGRIRETLAARDAAALAKLLHKLRGSLGMVGAGIAHAVAQEFEDKAAAADLADGAVLCKRLEHEVERACAALGVLGR
jgi:HPt (histidine-containing phosphotransfer) domain-containing protein